MNFYLFYIIQKIENILNAFKVIDSGKSIILQRFDGSTLRYHSTWLRDNALDPKTRDPKNGQRLITLSDIPKNTLIKSAILDNKGENISLTFFQNLKKFLFLQIGLKNMHMM